MKGRSSVCFCAPSAAKVPMDLARPSVFACTAMPTWELPKIGDPNIVP